MTVNTVRDAVLTLIPDYPIDRVILFGSRATGQNRNDSDVDLIFEFSAPVSLLTLSSIQLRLEEILQLNVDVIHGPLQETDLLEVSEEVEIYAA